MRGVDLELGEGLFGLLGPNGAGKSTFMQVVAGLIEPTAGKVVLDGHDIVQDPRFMHQRLGYLPQDFGFHPDLSGLAMLELLLKLKGITGPRGRRQVARELLERVNLAHAANRKVAGYSGGMRQRLGLAQAIAGDPRVLIVDEPTAGLDPEERHRFYRLLAEMGSKRIVILSTHIVEDVATLCPRLAVIRGGEVVAEDDPSVGGNIVAAVGLAVCRRLAVRVEREDAHREKGAVIAVGDRIGRDRCDHEPGGVDRLAAREREHAYRRGTGRRDRSPSEPTHHQPIPPRPWLRQAARTAKQAVTGAGRPPSGSR